MSVYKIISCDGGGVRGAFTTQVLKRLTEKYGLYLKSTNMFAGTSTGSIIAAGLAMGLSIKKVAGFYTEENCKHIFSKRRFFGFMLVGPKYSNQPLYQFLSGHYTGNPQFQDLKEHALVLSSFKLDSSYTGDWLTVFFHNRQDPQYLSGKLEFDYRDLHLVDAVMASSAAPLYFPSYYIQGKGTYIDGGVVANNPGMAAIAVATGTHHLDRQNVSNIRLLSIANGMKPKHVEGRANWGLLQWLNPRHPLVDVLTDGVSDADHYYCMSLLGDRYRRLQIQLEEPVALDDYKAVPLLGELANSSDDAFEKELKEIAEWFNAA